MSFINQYSKGSQYHYSYIEEFNGDEHFIYAVGHFAFQNALLTKVDNNGEVILEKKYSYNEDSIIFNKIIKLNEPGNDNYLIYATVGNLVVLTKINSDGEVLLSKAVIWEDYSDSDFPYVDIFSHPTLDKFYLTLSVQPTEPPIEIKKILLLEFSNDINVTFKKHVFFEENDFQIQTVKKSASGFAIYGNVLKYSQAGDGVEGLVLGSGIFTVKYDFKVLGFNFFPHIGAIDMVFNEVNPEEFTYIVAGIDTEVQNEHVLIKLTNNSIRRYYGLNQITELVRKSNSNFLVNTIDSCFDLDFSININWNKKITVSNDDTGISKLTFNNFYQKLSFISNPDEKKTTEFALGYTDGNLDSCKTAILAKPILLDKHMDLSTMEFDEEVGVVKFKDLEVQLDDVISQKKVICPVLEDTCVKDADLCKIYDTMYDVFTKCLKKPKLINLGNISEMIPCMDNFLHILQNLNEEYPQYHLIQYHFQTQLSLINAFINNPTVENYSLAWQAVNQILTYISSLGNCNCENTITIKENTYLQSPNFYLQSAGSLGQDSTKGIHLRWFFSGVLGEKHLPKGDYAANTFNFNKPNDFVKIYRTPYVQETFTLDFSLAPTTVNHTQKFWLYKFNGDTRIFFVYFKNNAKYNQAKALYNPLTQPLEFIKEYGNEVIEIENKRELFFASELKLEHDGTSNLKLEALSVVENKVFAPKVLSFRENYSASALNNGVRVVCENGRNIRFQPNNCLVTQIRFEFYSDFITKTTSNGAWQLLGNYALTTNDDLAFTQLDPDPNNLVKGAWLRYNDDAYVDTDNYEDKWSGPVEPWNRNIKDIVNRYIDLSNDYDNPRANEILDVNLANTDILTVGEPEYEDGNMEISNLDMLRISSYDYHIARMLGLGVLDLDSIILDGEYIYLGEYYTYGDLEDGSDGEVHHLSMGLPTSLFTQRLTVPVDLKELVPGFIDDSENDDNESSVTDADGYTFDGKKRYISIFSEELQNAIINPAFFVNSFSFDNSTFTVPIYAGLEYRKVLLGDTDDGIWVKPELSHKNKYFNIDDTSEESYETTSILIPEIGSPLFTHRQTQSGKYYYASYGINWFSRATSSEIVLDITTDIKPTNSLLAPTNVLPYLITHENPLSFTSQNEQIRLSAIPANTDKTLIRLLFDFNAYHEIISYQVPIDSLSPDAFYETDIDSIFRDQDEIFGDQVEIYFRTKTPRTITAKADDLIGDYSPITSLIHTNTYFQASTGENLLSEFPPDTDASNFIGSVFVMGDQEYIIHSILPGVHGLDFVVYKRQVSEGIMSNDIPTINTQNLAAPTIEGDGYFTVVENMQNSSSWGTAGNPNSLLVQLGNSDWGIHRELVKFQNDNGSVVKNIEKTRGFWQSVTVDKFLGNFSFQQADGTIIQKTQTHRGIYKITFDNYQLANHPQFHDNGVSVEWFNGYVRLFTESNLISGQFFDSRKSFTVFKTENIGTANNLVLYINDPNFQLDNSGNPSSDNDIVITGNNITVNYYPSYKVYLYFDQSHNLTEPIIMPAEGEGSRFSIFGLKTVDLNNTNSDGSFYKSKFSVPGVMVAQEVIDALPPEGPLGSLYATRPDFYGKSTYTLTTEFNHKPNGVSFYRADNQGLLSSIYETATIAQIKSDLNVLGGDNEEYFTNRWNNFFNFDDLLANGDYNVYPPVDVSTTNYKFPLPDKKYFFEEINYFIQYQNSLFPQNVPVPIIQETAYGHMHLNDIIIPASGQNQEIKLIDFVKEVILNVFIPLTELPILYKYIKPSTYKPINKKQVVRDRNGYLLNPATSSDFDMAPMMKVVATTPKHKTQFTDFTLDGTIDNIYFYAAKEISSLMKMSDFSPILGPIKLVNSNPPEAPKVKSVLPVLEDALGLPPSISFEISAYPEVQNIKKINLYRTMSRLDAESVQSMDLVKVIDIESAGLTAEAIWSFTDEFDDLPEVPFGDGLFYRITVSRQVEYADASQNVIVEYAPSQPSKILASVMVEADKPESPYLTYYSEPLVGTTLEGIVLSWDKTCYKGKYHLYKMSEQGNWIKIHELKTNNETIYLPLENTDLLSRDLVVLKDGGKPFYHHFKVITENTAGRFSIEEKILTIYNIESWQDVGGISLDGIDGMIVEGTFVVRPN